MHQWGVEGCCISGGWRVVVLDSIGCCSSSFTCLPVHGCSSLHYSAPPPDCLSATAAVCCLLHTNHQTTSHVCACVRACRSFTCPYLCMDAVRYIIVPSVRPDCLVCYCCCASMRSSVRRSVTSLSNCPLILRLCLSF